MGQSHFALDTLLFDEAGQLYARDAQGVTLKRRAEWNAWAPLPTYVFAAPAPNVPPPRTWDANGNLYSSSNVIYRLAPGSDEWKLVPGSLGKSLQTVDPAGNVFALGSGGSEVLLEGATTWVASPGVTRVDAQGRAYFGNQRLDGTTVVADELLQSGRGLFDAHGDVLEFVAEGERFRITRRPFGSKDTTELAKFTSTLTGLELLGCGLEGTCMLFKAPSAVFQVRRGEALRQVGATDMTSSNAELNFSGFKLFVGPEGRLYLTDLSGNASLVFSRVVRLKPHPGTWPGQEQP